MAATAFVYLFVDRFTFRNELVRVKLNRISKKAVGSYVSCTDYSQTDSGFFLLDLESLSGIIITIADPPRVDALLTLLVCLSIATCKMSAS